MKIGKTNQQKEKGPRGDTQEFHTNTKLETVTYAEELPQTRAGPVCPASALL